MQPAKEPADSERDRNSGIWLMLDGINDYGLKRSGRLRDRSCAFPIWGCSVVCWTQVRFFGHDVCSGADVAKPGQQRLFQQATLGPSA